jgi:hypothetical protein
MVNGNNITYTSTLASSSSSRVFSLVARVPYRHLKVLDQERTNHLVQDQEQEIPATERSEK